MALRKTFGALRVNYLEANSTAPDKVAPSQLCAFAFSGSQPTAITRIIGGFSPVNNSPNGEARLFVLSVDGSAELEKLAKDNAEEFVELKYGVRVILDVSVTGHMDLDFSTEPIVNRDGRITVVLLQVPRDYDGVTLDCAQYLNVRGYAVTDGSSDIIYPPNWRGR